MSSTLISFGLAFLVAMQAAAQKPDVQTPATTGKTVTVRASRTTGDQRETGQPRQVRPKQPVLRQPRPTGRPTFSPNRARTTDASRPTRSDNASTSRSAAVRKTTIVPLEHVPVVEIVEPVSRWLESQKGTSGRQDATIIPVAITNSLFVSGLPDQLEAIHTMIKILDQPVPQFRVKAMLAELALAEAPKPGTGSTSETVLKGGADIGKIVAELEKRGTLRVLARPELLAQHNQPAFLQSGSRQPRITGSMTANRARSNQVELENIGTILGVTGRVSKDDLVSLELDLERSYLGPEEEGTVLASNNDAPDLRMAAVKVQVLQTTVSVRSGQTAVIGGMVYHTEHGWGELVLLLQVEVVR